jgi:hypothetical protein
MREQWFAKPAAVSEHRARSLDQASKTRGYHQGQQDVLRQKAEDMTAPESLASLQMTRRTAFVVVAHREEPGP